MSEFYHLIPQATTKAEALRQAQLNLLNDQTNAVDLSRVQKSLGTNSQALENSLSHPFYWAGFSMISSPW